MFEASVIDNWYMIYQPLHRNNFYTGRSIHTYSNKPRQQNFPFICGIKSKVSVKVILEPHSLSIGND